MKSQKPIDELVMVKASEVAIVNKTKENLLLQEEAQPEWERCSSCHRRRAKKRYEGLCSVCWDGSQRCNAVCVVLDRKLGSVIKPTFQPTCMGSCRNKKWNNKLRAYVCTNCGKVDR